MQPINYNVLVTLDDPTTQSEGGIDLPQDWHKSEWGTVKAVGNQCEHLKEGDVVLLPATPGTEIGTNDMLIDERLVLLKRD